LLSETLEEIAMEANHEFKEHGGEEFRAIPCLNMIVNGVKRWVTGLTNGQL
jgi:ferrochelatase